MEAEMAKQRWKGSIKAFQSHMDPEKEEQLKGIKIGNYSTWKQPQYLQCYEDCGLAY